MIKPSRTAAAGGILVEAKLKETWIELVTISLLACLPCLLQACFPGGKNGAAEAQHRHEPEVTLQVEYISLRNNLTANSRPTLNTGFLPNRIRSARSRSTEPFCVASLPLMTTQFLDTGCNSWPCMLDLMIEEFRVYAMKR